MADGTSVEKASSGFPTYRESAHRSNSDVNQLFIALYVRMILILKVFKVKLVAIEGLFQFSAY
jgi:hypothetical protein